MRNVRLRQDVEGYGRKGSIVPIPAGQMRNAWYPQRIADYVTMQELKTLRRMDTPMARDYDFVPVKPLKNSRNRQSVLTKPIEPAESQPEPPKPSPAVKLPEVLKLTPERSSELLEIFTPARLDFYRQPIIEQQQESEIATSPETPNIEQTLQGKGSAADLLEFRMRARKAAKEVTPPKPVGPQAIYGSVSTHDLLTAVRSALERNDEAGRVILHEDDIKIVEAYDPEAVASGKVKHIGEANIEIKIKGSDSIIKRVVRINAQAG